MRRFKVKDIACCFGLFLDDEVEAEDEIEAKKAMVKYVKKFQPNPDAVKKYEYLFNNVYSKVYPKLKKVYGNLTDYLTSNNERGIE